MSATKRLAEQAGVIPAENRPADYDAREEATIRYLIELDREAKIRQEAEDRAPLGWSAKF